MIKKSLDIFGAIIGLLILSPILIVITCLVRAKLGSPVLFTQNRPGLNGKIFKFYKFRSMTDEVDRMGVLLSDSRRLTPFGSFLRSSSLDELPSFFNVIKGDMSLVGPRPLLVKYLPLYSKTQARRHEVKPGITGWAQVNGRNGISWDEKFELDVWYVDNHTFYLDIKIILKTIVNVIKRKDINYSEDDTMPIFDGK